MDKIDELVEIWLDPTARIDERDDAAIDLGKYDDDRALNALLSVVLDPIGAALTIRIPDKSIVHSIILIGAKPGYVYFIDPNDSYNPQKPEAQPIYIISFARLTANATNEFGTNALNSIFAFSK